MVEDVIYGPSPHGSKMAAAALDITFSQYVSKVKNHKGSWDNERALTEYLLSFIRKGDTFPCWLPYDSLGHMITREQRRLEKKSTWEEGKSGRAFRQPRSNIYHREYFEEPSCIGFLLLLWQITTNVAVKAITWFYYLTDLEVRSPKWVLLGQNESVNKTVFFSEALGENLVPVL